MTDVIFRTKSVPTPSVDNNVAKTPDSVSTTDEVLSYTEYQNKTSRPYLADHYELGDTWEVFNNEIQSLDQVIQDKIKSGEISNTPEAVKKVIKEMEKFNNLKDEDRTVIKLGILSSYAKFLDSKNKIRRESLKYGTN